MLVALAFVNAARAPSYLSAILGVSGLMVVATLALIVVARRAHAELEARVEEQAAQLAAQAAAQAQQAALRADVGEALARTDDLSVLLQRCAEAMVERLDAAFARIWTLSKDESTLELQASAGLYTRLDGPHAGWNSSRHAQ